MFRGGGGGRMDPSCLDHHNPPPMENQKWWRQDSGLATLRHPVKNKRVTVQGPVKKPKMDYMSHGGGGGGRESLERREARPIPPQALALTLVGVGGMGALSCKY